MWLVGVDFYWEILYICRVKVFGGAGLVGLDILGALVALDILVVLGGLDIFR